MITEAVILAGGKGTRLRSAVSDRPKPMAEVAGRPFVEWILLCLTEQGLSRAVMAVGYGAQTVREALGDGSELGLELAYSEELTPRGTAGALADASLKISGENFLVLNGDSFAQFSARDLGGFHTQHSAVATLLLSPMAKGDRYGSVVIDEDGAILAFDEKLANNTGFLANAGVYAMNRQIVDHIASAGPVSLEAEVFPGLVGRGLMGFVGGVDFLDIGTPESYAAASDWIRDRRCPNIPFGRGSSAIDTRPTKQRSASESQGDLQ